MKTEDDPLRITLTGAAGLVCSYREETLLVDPYYSRLGKWQVLLARVRPDREMIRLKAGEIGPISAMVVSHSHFDHAFDVPELARYTRGKSVGSASLDTLMAASGEKGRVTVCRGGEKVRLSENIRVTMLPSVHGRVLLGLVPYPGEIRKGGTLPFRAKDYWVGRVFSPKIDMGGRTFLHVGSAGFDERALAGQRCDTVFLCVPGWKMMKGYPERILELTGAGTVVLFHQDDFFRPLEKGRAMKTIAFADVEGLVRRIRSNAPGVKVLVPAVGETLEF